MHWNVIVPTLDFWGTVHLLYVNEQVEGQGLTFPRTFGMLSGDTIYSTSDSKHTWCSVRTLRRRMSKYISPQCLCFLFGTYWWLTRHYCGWDPGTGKCKAICLHEEYQCSRGLPSIRTYVKPQYDHLHHAHIIMHSRIWFKLLDWGATPPHVTRKVAQNTRPSFSHVWEGLGTRLQSLYPYIPSLVPRLSQNANMYRWKSLVSFLRKHDVIKIGLQQKGNVLRIVQSTMRSTLGVWYLTSDN